MHYMWISAIGVYCPGVTALHARGWSNWSIGCGCCHHVLMLSFAARDCAGETKKWLGLIHTAASLVRNFPVWDQLFYLPRAQLTIIFGLVSLCLETHLILWGSRGLLPYRCLPPEVVGFGDLSHHSPYSQSIINTFRIHYRCCSSTKITL